MKLKHLVLAVIVIFLLVVKAVPAQNESPRDINELIKECQILYNHDKRVSLVWWLPSDFWELSFTKNNSMRQDEIDEMISYIDPYLIFIVVDGKTGPYGGITFKSDNEILGSISVKDKEGNSHYPILETDMNSNLRNLMSSFKPQLANMLGSFGENMYIYYFDGLNAQNEKLADPKLEGELTVILDNKDFHWDLPLETAVPPQTCSTCKKSMSGVFKFCPWDGTKLERKEK